MIALNAESTTTETAPVVSGVEGEIAGLFRKEMARKPMSDAGGQNGAEGLTSLIGRVAGRSVEEIESLISELQEVRNFLRAEGERLQRDLTNFAQMNQTALASVKVIHESIGPWKSGVAADKRPLS